MSRFTRYINNLYKQYIGIIKVVIPSTRSKKMRYGYGIELDTANGQCVLFKGDVLHHYRIENDRLVFDRRVVKENHGLTSNYILDVYSTDDPAEAAPVSKIHAIMNQKAISYRTEAEQLFLTFNRILENSMTRIRRTNEITTRYSKTGDSSIKIEDAAIEARKPAWRIPAVINTVQVQLEHGGNGIFRVIGNYDSIPHAGQVSMLLLNQSEIMLLRKYGEARNILTFSPNPSSSTAKLFSLLSKQVVNYDSRQSMAIPFTFPFNADQVTFFSRLYYDPLVIAGGSAGTGKTTTTAYGIVNLANSGRRALVVAAPHRVVDNLLNKVIAIDSGMKTRVIRLASYSTLKHVSQEARQYHESQVYLRIKQETLDRLDIAMNKEKDTRIKDIQVDLKKLIEVQKADVFRQLVTLSSAAVFSTVDSLLGNIKRLATNKLDIGQFQQYLQEFDLTVFEDTSDLNFVDFIIGSQISHRWALSGDSKQIGPVVESSTSIPRYSERTLPSDNDEVETINSLESITLGSLSKYRSLSLGEQSLRIPITEILLSTDDFKQKLGFTELTKNYRFPEKTREVLQEVFPDIKFEKGITSASKSEKEKEAKLLEIYDFPFVFVEGKPPGKGKFEVEVTKDDGKTSYQNEHEAEIVLDKLRELLVHTKQYGLSLNIGIITPYTPQSKLLKDKVFDKRDEFHLYENSGQLVHVDSDSTITVETTHKQKSREFDIALISLTRSDISGLARREDYMFTALTRAKYMTLLVFDLSGYHGMRPRDKPRFWKKLLALEKKQRKS
ncbi:MAG: AAA domain-containing protein [Candidatus Odinarchaeota archaeon]